MSRAARVVGWAVFAVTLLGAGAIGFALLGVRSPLADGSVAPGPEPAAYVIVGGVVIVGAAVAGVVAAGLTALVVRLARR